MALTTANPAHNPLTYAVDDLFSLMVEHHTQTTRITMKLFTPTVNTRDIPWTYPFLKKHLPGILSAKCFNEENLPFSIEVRKTEIGHLFEHMLLEYLCQEKLLKGHNRAMFSGNTKWNWKRDPWGMFHIYINLHASDTDIFPAALKKSIALLTMIIRNEQAALPAYPEHSFQEAAIPSLRRAE